MKLNNYLSLQTLITALHNKDISSVELMQFYLKRIEEYQELNVFISFDGDYALKQAQAADVLFQQNRAQLLTGIPIAHKDNFCTHHFKTTCASKMLAQYQSPFEATIVKKLAQAGAITVGKTNLDEFAMGSSNQTSYFGPVKNPWNPEYSPGGSSGGSAAAVSADLVVFATASDTGGSIRQPAAFCGVSGIKPTYGLVSRWGLTAYASSLDQAGIIGKSSEDLAIILGLMAGFDPLDSTSVNSSIPSYTATLKQSIKNKRIGLPKCFLNSPVKPETQEIIQSALTCFENAGAIIVELDLTSQPLWVPCYYVIACAEASSNLSRYDGIRFGYRADNTTSLQKLIIQSRTEGFGNEVKKRILLGTYVLSTENFETHYQQALKVRNLIQREFNTAFQKVDFIIGPTTPFSAPKLGEPKKCPTQNYLADVFTVAVNLAGLPAISIPGGFHEGMPMGLQLIGPQFSESLLLNVAYQYQQMTDWHLYTPKEGL